VYKCLDPDHEQIYAYTRTLGENRFLILLNFSEDTVTYTLPHHITYNRKEKVISNTLILDDKTYREFMLSGWQAVVYRLED